MNQRMMLKNPEKEGAAIRAAMLKAKSLLENGVLMGGRMDRRNIPTINNGLLHMEARVRILAITALTKVDDWEKVRRISAMLWDDDWSVRATAAEHLGNAGDAKAVPVLISALFDQSQYVRATVVDALGRIGDKRAVPFLEWIAAREIRVDKPVPAAHEYSFVIRAAKEALAKITGATAHNRLSDEGPDEIALIGQLAGSGRSAQPVEWKHVPPKEFHGPQKELSKKEVENIQKGAFQSRHSY